MASNQSQLPNGLCGLGSPLLTSGGASLHQLQVNDSKMMSSTCETQFATAPEHILPVSDVVSNSLVSNSSLTTKASSAD